MTATVLLLMMRSKPPYVRRRCVRADITIPGVEDLRRKIIRLVIRYLEESKIDKTQSEKLGMEMRRIIILKVENHSLIALGNAGSFANAVVKLNEKMR